MNKIYYFSGTGNTLKAARDFAAELENTELISISDLDRSAEVDPGDAEKIGIFCPVYCFGIPRIVHAFLNRIKANSISPNTYVFAVCTSGGMRGVSTAIIEDILAERGIRLTAAFHVIMPSCYLPLSNPPKPRRMEKIFARAKQKIADAIADVKAHKRIRPLRVFPLDMIVKFIAARAITYLQKYDHYFWTQAKCDGCGICAKVCPCGNITINSETKRPVWHGSCEQCMGCIQFCPQEALQFRDALSLKRRRYHHPEITAADIAGKRFFS